MFGVPVNPINLSGAVEGQTVVWNGTDFVPLDLASATLVLSTTALTPITLVGDSAGDLVIFANSLDLVAPAFFQSNVTVNWWGIYLDPGQSSQIVSDGNSNATLYANTFSVPNLQQSYGGFPTASSQDSNATVSVVSGTDGRHLISYSNTYLATEAIDEIDVTFGIAYTDPNVLTTIGPADQATALFMQQAQVWAVPSGDGTGYSIWMESSVQPTNLNFICKTI